jgi:hypothetical protein
LRSVIHVKYARIPIPADGEALTPVVCAPDCTIRHIDDPA